MKKRYNDLYDLLEKAHTRKLLNKIRYAVFSSRDNYLINLWKSKYNSVTNIKTNLFTK